MHHRGNRPGASVIPGSSRALGLSNIASRLLYKDAAAGVEYRGRVVALLWPWTDYRRVDRDLLCLLRGRGSLLSPR